MKYQIFYAQDFGRHTNPTFTLEIDCYTLITSVFHRWNIRFLACKTSIDTWIRMSFWFNSYTLITSVLHRRSIQSRARKTSVDIRIPLSHWKTILTHELPLCYIVELSDLMRARALQTYGSHSYSWIRTFESPVCSMDEMSKLLLASALQTYNSHSRTLILILSSQSC